MIQSMSRPTLILFEKAVDHGDTFRGLVALSCGHTVTYRTKNLFFINQIQGQLSWPLPCKRCDGDAA